MLTSAPICQACPLGCRARELCSNVRNEAHNNTKDTENNEEDCHTESTLGGRILIPKYINMLSCVWIMCSIFNNSRWNMGLYHVP
mmetsp:Transcript_39012/g.117281  ORF Transcript_39012/g.117281 Transcript_39012/m.117281 type:complete len:85 (+) Transcript_39012:902-1156(+)